MKLELEHGRTLNRADALAIEEAMMTLPAENSGFAILSESEATYIQAVGCRNQGFEIEYQADGTDAHFRAKNGKIRIEEVVRAFQSYSNGDGAWKAMFEWELYDVSANAKRGCRGAAAVVLVVIPTLAAAVIGAVF